MCLLTEIVRKQLMTFELWQVFNSVVKSCRCVNVCMLHMCGNHFYEIAPSGCFNVQAILLVQTSIKHPLLQLV